MQDANITDFGPQYHRDDEFTKRMRFHQSWYRATELRVPCGVGPHADSPNRYGNMLTAEDAGRDRNFLTPTIAEVARARLDEKTGVVERYRLLHNMMSSQPMCFNLFGLMVGDPDTATRLWRAVLGDEVGKVTRVAFEHAPTPAAEYLDDHTAFDAFVEYELASGGRAFLGIETKLTEPFSQAECKLTGAYERWMADGPWRVEARDRFTKVAHNQLFRDHLLAVAMRKHPESPYQHGRLLLVRHPADTKCAKVVQGYQGLLKDGDDTFLDSPLDVLLDRWAAAGLPAGWGAWADAFRRRYLDLGASAEMYDMPRSKSLEERENDMNDDSYIIGRCEYEYHPGPITQDEYEHEGCWTCRDHFSESEDSPYIHTAEASLIFGVSKRTICLWTRQGKLKARLFSMKRKNSNMPKRIYAILKGQSVK